MYNEFEKEDDSWRPPQKKWWVITKKVLGYTVIALALAFIAFLIVRMIISKPPKGITELVWTDKAFEAYTSAKESGSKLAVLQISSSDSFDKGDGDENKSDDMASAMTSIYATYYIPAVNEIQFTVRFNDRLVNYLEKDYPEARKMFEDGKELYSFVLTFEYEDEKRQVTDYRFIKDEKAGYTYRRLVFDIGEGVEIEKVSTMSVEVYYVGNMADVRHKMFVYKSTFGRLEYDYDVPKAATKGFSVKDGK
jgi:hypothetical protein